MYKNILEDIKSIIERDPAARTVLEVILCYPGFHAVFIHKLTHCLWKKNFRIIARMLSQFARFISGIEIHPGATIGRRFFIDHGMGVVIGETSVIGDDVTMYHGVTLGGTSLHEGVRHPKIGNRVVIGSGAQILGPVKIGNDAKIGANAVVVKDVESGQTMVGVPARRTKLNISKNTGILEEFSAYGTDHGEVLDPNKRDLDQLMKEIKYLQRRISELEGRE